MKRAVIALLSLLSLFSLMIYGSVEHDKKDPDMDYILFHYEEFLGKEVHFSGKVLDGMGNEYELKLIEAPYTKINVTINATLKKGDIVEVLGILDTQNHVTAKDYLVMKKWDYWLIFIRSLPAIPFVLYLFFKEWKFNVKKFRFEVKRNA